MTAQPIPYNFAFLKEHDEKLVRFGMLAERYFPDDPNTRLLKLRQLTELLAELVAAHTGLYVSSEEAQFDLIRRLQDRGLLPREVPQLFGEVRRAGHAAVHEGTGDHRTFEDRPFRSGPFIPPVAPADESSALRAELDRLTKTLSESRETHAQAAHELQATQERLKSTQADRKFWEAMTSEADQARGALEKRLAEVQTAATANPPNVSEFIQAATAAAEHVDLNEAGTRWRKGEEIQRFDPSKKKEIELFTAPDEVQLDIEDFNRKVVTEPFNRVVCEILAKELDPNAPQKTLAFCANNSHLDLVVKLLKDAFVKRYGEVDDDAVLKITGSADQPLQLIRRHKNERLPNATVTVDLLTTGIDVRADGQCFDEDPL